MSEFINNSSQRKELLRHMLVRLHEGESPDLLRNRLIEVLRGIPYNEVVEVEQELIDNAILSEEEILEFATYTQPSSTAVSTWREPKKSLPVILWIRSSKRTLLCEPR